MRGESHSDVEYVVDCRGTQRIYGTFDEALSAAFGVAVSSGRAQLDVLIYSEEGAEVFGGDSAVDEYNEDPEASVFRRFEIKVNDRGRVP
ncbi:MAG: hypothetical protein SF187_23685 [Deltaproteobacteria bacterium]|nr:hypothetical protein [Deltaproteobacteria bacterium]